MTDSEIRVGDVCLDLTDGSPVHVLEDTGQNVVEWSKDNDYDLADNYGNSRLDTDNVDRVFEVVYCSSIKSKPSKTYAMPESRLRRVETEAADGGRPVADRVRAHLLEEVFGVVVENGNASLDEADWLKRWVAELDGIDGDLVDEAYELAEAEAWDPQPAELRDGETPDDDSHAARNAEQLAMAEESDEPERHEPADFGGGETTGVQDLGTFDEEVSE